MHADSNDPEKRETLIIEGGGGRALDPVHIRKAWPMLDVEALLLHN